jgi:surface protein
MVSEGSVEMSTSQVNRELGIDDDDMGGEGEGEGAPDHGEWLEKAEAHQAATANAGAGAVAKSMMPPPVALQQSESGLTVAFGALGKSTTPPPRAAGGASRKPILLPTIHQRARLMFLMVLLTPFAIAAAAAQDEPATLAAIVQQMSSLQQRVALVETENADLRLELAEVKGVRQGPPNAHFAVSSLGQSRQLGESPETCCRWTPGETCQTTEEVCTMVHEYIEGKALTVEFLDAENAQCLGSNKDAWSASFDGSTANVTLSNAAGVVTTTPTPLKVTHAVNCTAELPTLTLQLPTVVASTLLVGGYDVAAAFAKLGAPLANASESPPPSSPPTFAFTDKASLRAAAEAYDADAATATATYGPIADWDVSAVTDMSSLFQNLAQFNADISSWDTSGVTTMYHMFYGAAALNQPLSFDTSSVTSMANMFSEAQVFNQPLDFDTSRVTTMNSMFWRAYAFNQPLDFDTSRVTTMNSMFQDAQVFNQPLDFDTSSVTDMSGMFYRAYAFNQPLSFDTSRVTAMHVMFWDASAFNQPLSFDMSSNPTTTNMFSGSSGSLVQG